MYLPLADCTVIAFIAPLLATVLSVFILGEKFGFHRWGGELIILRNL